MLSLERHPRNHTPESDVSYSSAKQDTLYVKTDPITDVDNHKPDISPDNTSATARLKQTNKDGTFNLGLDDNGNRYMYNGVRTTKDGNYVLIFDPARQVFVLHRLDSLFHMNVTRTPGTSDVDSLRKQFPQFEVQPSSSSRPGIQDTPKVDSKASKATPKPDDTSKPTKTRPAKASSALRSKPANKKPPTQKKAAGTPRPDPTALMPPPPPPPTTAPSTKRRARSPDSEEDEEEDGDFGLIIEDPGQKDESRHRNTNAFGQPYQQPPVSIARRFSDFVRDGEDDGKGYAATHAQEQKTEEQEDDIAFDFEAGDDEDDEMEDVGVLDQFKLPSPVDGRNQQNAGLGLGAYQAEVIPGDDDADGEDDDDPDLEADLEAAFEDEMGSDDDNGAESDVSVED